AVESPSDVDVVDAVHPFHDELATEAFGDVVLHVLWDGQPRTAGVAHTGVVDNINGADRVDRCRDFVRQEVIEHPEVDGRLSARTGHRRRRGICCRWVTRCKGGWCGVFVS